VFIDFLPKRLKVSAFHKLSTVIKSVLDLSRCAAWCNLLTSGNSCKPYSVQQFSIIPVTFSKWLQGFRQRLC